MRSRATSTAWALRLSDTTGPPRAVLDSDVIYSRVLHELFGRLAHQERLLTLDGGSRAKLVAASRAGCSTPRAKRSR